MPKRSNSFQRLVYLFKTLLADKGTVTESKELIDRVTGEKVEVDVCIETANGGDTLITSVECTKRGRRANLGWVNEMLAKHQSLPTNLLVLASGSGFVRNAKKKAEASGAKLISLNNLSEATVRSVMGEVANIAMLVTEISLKHLQLRLAAIAGIPERVVDATSDYSVYTSDGRRYGSLKQIVDVIMQTDHFNEVGRIPTDGPKSFSIEWSAKLDGQAPCLRTDGALLHPIVAFRFLGTYEVRSADLRVGNSSLDSREIVWGEGKAPFFETDTVIVKTLDDLRNEKVSAMIGPHFLEPKDSGVKSPNWAALRPWGHLGQDQVETHLPADGRLMPGRNSDACRSPVRTH